MCSIIGTFAIGNIGLGCVLVNVHRHAPDPVPPDVDSLKGTVEGLIYDDEIRTFLGVQQSGWEVLCAVAVGNRASGETQTAVAPGTLPSAMDWRD